MNLSVRLAEQPVDVGLMQAARDHRRVFQHEELRLVREPKNRHDSNAIAVHRAATNEQLGYLAGGCRMN
jgi:HIRAN domain-containing protein